MLWVPPSLHVCLPVFFSFSVLGCEQECVRACVCTRALVLSGSSEGTLSFHVLYLHGHCGQYCSAFSRRFSQAQHDNIMHIVSERVLTYFLRKWHESHRARRLRVPEVQSLRAEPHLPEFSHPTAGFSLDHALEIAESKEDLEAVT